LTARLFGLLVLVRESCAVLKEYPKSLIMLLCCASCTVTVTRQISFVFPAVFKLFLCIDLFSLSSPQLLSNYF